MSRPSSRPHGHRAAGDAAVRPAADAAPADPPDRPATQARQDGTAALRPLPPGPQAGRARLDPDAPDAAPDAAAVEAPNAAAVEAPAEAPAPALAETFRATLARGIHGLCFSPYLDRQRPGDGIGAEQIRTRLQILAPHCRWVRSFSCTDGHEQTPRIAYELGLKTLVGAWLGRDAAINAREIEGLIAVARAGHADLVAVGNEVLLREDLSEDELLACIRQVQAALPGVPVGYVDAYYLFEQHPRITAACDVVMTNCYPFWEGCPREQALPYMQSMLARTRAAAPGKRILISETGWPDQGSAFHGAVPGREAAMQYFVDTAAWADTEGLEWFHFAAFDEAWKVGAEGDVGAFWGLWDADGQLKFG